MPEPMAIRGAVVAVDIFKAPLIAWPGRRADMASDDRIWIGRVAATRNVAPLTPISMEEIREHLRPDRPG